MTTATAPGAEPPAQQIENWLQYTHLDKLYGYLPGIKGALPAIFGLEPAAFEQITESYAAAARQAADELLADVEMAAAVDRLPFRPGQRILAVGDSITDDLQSWAEILRELLRRRHPDVTVINGGLSAHTTAMVLRRWPAQLAAEPDRILCLLGGNDVTRIGPEPAKSQVSLDESMANLRELRRIAAHRTDAAWVWLTPIPVQQQRADGHPGFAFGQSRWHNSDVLALAEQIVRMATPTEPVIDLTEVFGDDSIDTLQGPDGVHPSMAGQVAIVRAVIGALAG